jgi:hypothetical protein
MDFRPRSSGRPGPNPSPRTAGTGGRTGASPRLRFDRTVGFWLGAAVLGPAGCFVGFAMPYSHPVAVTANVLWWGVFLGCLGGSVCAVAGLWAEPTRPSPAPGPWHRSTARAVVRRGPSRFSEEHNRRF